MNIELKKFIPSPSDVLATMAFLALAYQATTLFGDPGLGWHLIAGEWMITHREVIRSDPFTFAHTLKFGSSAVWIHDQWLGDIIFALLIRFGGLNLLQVFIAAIATLPIAFFIGPELERNTRDALGSFFLLLFCLLSISLQWFARPVIFSFMFFASYSKSSCVNKIGIGFFIIFCGGICLR